MVHFQDHRSALLSVFDLLFFSYSGCFTDLIELWLSHPLHSFTPRLFLDSLFSLHFAFSLTERINARPCFTFCTPPVFSPALICSHWIRSVVAHYSAIYSSPLLPPLDETAEHLREYQYTPHTQLTLHPALSNALILLKYILLLVCLQYPGIYLVQLIIQLF